jgi:outer membrane protein assembly factor BamE
MRKSLRILRAPAALAAVLALSACGAYNSYVPGFITPYRSDVQQGNWVTSEMVALLKPGMTREQVRFALGSPALTDIFHADRWDYPYSFLPGRGKAEQRLLTVFFENDRLARWSGDEMPDRQPFQKEPPPRAVNVPIDNPAQRPPVTTPAEVGSGNPLPGRIAVAGASGRMGRMLIETIAAAPDATLAGALDHEGNPFIGRTPAPSRAS